MNRCRLAVPLILATVGCGQSFRDILFGPSSVVQKTPAPSSPVPSMGSTPIPTPVPTSSPEECEGCPDVPTNTNPVAKVGARVYFLECGGSIVPDSANASATRVGCRVHFDCTAKDSGNQPTRAKGGPNWTFSDSSLVYGGDRASYTPAVTASKRGVLRAWVEIDGVRSNTVEIRFY